LAELCILPLEEIVDCLNVLVLARVGRPDNCAHENGVFVDEVYELVRGRDVLAGSAVPVALLHLEVPCGLLPAHLHGSVHDEVGLVDRLACSPARILPSPLGGEDSEDDGFGRTDGAHS